MSPARRACSIAAVALVLALGRGDARADEAAAGADAAAGGADAAAPLSAWCAPELEALPGDVCYGPGATPTDGRRTLVIFLHGLTDDGSGWQIALQRGMLAAAKRWHFALLAPRGRNGIGPGRRADQIAWPTADKARADVEDDLVASWEAARKAIEARQGAPFDEVFVMGFSNGAYYASSLALRGRLDVDGYAVFAGGSAPKGMDRVAKRTANVRPVFVGIASRDETAKKGRELAKLLGDLRWPHEVSSRPVGHVVADVQLERALAYLRREVLVRHAKATAAPVSGLPAAVPGKR